MLTALLAVGLFTLTAWSSRQNAADKKTALAVNAENKTPSKGCCGATTQDTAQTYTLVGSSYNVKDAPTAVLMFNNKGPAPLVVSPTFYSLSGHRLDIPALTIPAASYQEFDLRELLAGNLPAFEEGSAQVTYQGGRLQLGVQVRMLDAARGLILEEQFVTPASRFVSNRLEAVWYAPTSDFDSRFILSNTTDAPVTATINVDGTTPKQKEPASFTLQAHETRVLDVLRDVVGGANGGKLREAGGISITQTGAPGAVLARFLIVDIESGFSLPVGFSDPQSPKSSRWHGAGLRLGKIGSDELVPVVAARNVGGAATVVKGRLPYTNSAGDVVFVNVPETNLKPGETKTIDLAKVVKQSNVPSSIKYTGLEFEYTGAPGSVVMNALSRSKSGQQVFAVPLLNPQRMPSTAGGFPWKADGDYTTLVHIKNETDQPRRYSVNLLYTGGDYSFGSRELKPGQSVAIDFKDLRDRQVPDFRGLRIPLNVERGQIGWTGHGKDNRVLSGRSEQVNTAIGISSGYACYNCCPNRHLRGEVTPDSAFGFFGDTRQFEAGGLDVNCSGQTFPYEPSVTWSSFDSGIASVGYYSGLATALDTGTTNIMGSWTGDSWFMTLNFDCEYTPVPVEEMGEMEVRPPTVNISNFEFVVKDSVEGATDANVEIQVVNNSNNSPISLRLVKTQGTGEARFPNGMTTMTVRQSTTVSIKGVEESSTKDNIRLEARFGNGNTLLDSDDFSVLLVVLSLRTGLSQKVSPNNASLTDWVRVVGTDDLGLIFKNGTVETPGYGTAVEIVGVVSPSNFTGTFALSRAFQARIFRDNNPNAVVSRDGSELPTFSDLNPQPDGKIYDLDAPGISSNQNTPLNAIARVRTAFTQGVTVNGIKAGNDLKWYSYLSIRKTTQGDVIVNDVSGDNRAGVGPANLTVNLQP